ncbi:MAG: hypothetical protein K8S16_03890 [Bacteroidales bacterium]|nr:hypothetical protein [Bacteroidales bacterium]
MKKTVLLLVIIIIIIGIGFIYNININYHRNFTKLQQKKTYNRIESPFYQYFLSYSECPNDLEDVIDFVSDKPIYYLTFDTKMLDELSNNNEYLRYFPLYNKTNQKREAFILLSAGIDGKINTHIAEKDTLFINDFMSKRLLYNEFDLDWYNNFTFDSITKFKLTNYFFGKKDYLLLYYNCLNTYLYRTKVTDLGFLNEKIFTKKFCNVPSIYSFSIVIEEISMINDNILIISKVNKYTLYCQLYLKPTDMFSVGDTISLIGHLKKCDLQNKFIEFNLCFVNP